ncbi:hypothetical protein ACFX2A_000950 [Malus domestica]
MQCAMEGLSWSKTTTTTVLPAGRHTPGGRNHQDPLNLRHPQPPGPPHPPALRPALRPPLPNPPRPVPPPLKKNWTSPNGAFLLITSNTRLAVLTAFDLTSLVKS